MNKVGRFVHHVLPALLLLVFFLSIWETICRLGWVPSYLLPSPTEVLAALFADRTEFFAAFTATALCGLAGFLLACAFGMAFALCLQGSVWISRAFYPYAVVFQTVPIIAVAPLLVIWLGYGAPTVAASAFLASVFPVILSTLTGLRATPVELSELFRLYGATSWDRFFKLTLPMALPSLLTGFRIAAGLAVIGAIVGEFVGGGGLGSVVDMARTQQRVDKVFAAVFLACVLGALAIGVLDAVNRKALQRWERGSR